MAISVAGAIQTIIEKTNRTNYEFLPIEQSINRICAQNIFSTHALPRFDNSAMDGYAIRFEDKNTPLKVVDTIFAGDDKTMDLNANECVKIMTGAKIPDNCTAIVPQEDVTELDKQTIQVPSNIKENQHIRYIGEDVKLGEAVVLEGEKINFAKITLMASQGITHIKTFKKPKVVVFASGEELKLHYEKVKEYQIYNSNTPTLIARCEEMGCEVNFIGQARDTVESIKEHIENCLDADLIVTSGGVSVGEADFTKEAFTQVGFESFFEGIIVKPGKPTIFGQIGSTLVLNLPGNPLASSLIFELFGKILIQRLKGESSYFPNTILGKMDEDLKNKQGRVTIVPGFFNGEYFTASQKRSPGMVSVLAKCNSMIVLNEDVQMIKKDASVKVLPINWEFFTAEEKDYLTYE